MLRSNLSRWVIAIIIFLGSAVYQRLTGPTYPVRGSMEFAGEEISYRLLTSHGGTDDCPVSLSIADSTITGKISFRRFKTEDPWAELPMARVEGELIGHLPHQPPAGKLLYRINLRSGMKTAMLPPGEPVVVRFKGGVPGPILGSHILFISLAMIFSNRAGLEALWRKGKPHKFVWWTAIALILGGLLLGPIVQKYAFGAYWTGWPWGHDLTDNKTLFAFLFWVAALFFGRGRRSARGWVITAAIVTLGVYLIPHSLLGSELDYSKVAGGQ